MRECFVDEDVERILQVKISRTAKIDLMGWRYNENGVYSVKSGYWLSTHIPGNIEVLPTNGNVTLRQKIWKTNVPPKVHHFVWKTLSQSLATGSNTRRRHITSYDECR